MFLTPAFTDTFSVFTDTSFLPSQFPVAFSAFTDAFSVFTDTSLRPSQFPVTFSCFHGHFFCFHGYFTSSLSVPGHFFCFNGHFALHDRFLSFRGAALLSVYPIPLIYFNPNRHDFPLKPSFTLDFPSQTCYPIIQIYSRDFFVLDFVRKSVGSRKDIESTSEEEEELYGKFLSYDTV